MAGDPDYQPMKTELDALQAATAAVTSAVDLARALTQTTSYEENSDVEDDAFLVNATSGTYYPILDSTGKGVLLDCGWYSRYRDFDTYIYVDGKYLKSLHTGMSVNNAWYFSNLVDYWGGECPWLKVTLDDTANSRFAMVLTKPIYFNSRILVTMRQNSGSGKVFGGTAICRKR